MFHVFNLVVKSIFMISGLGCLHDITLKILPSCVSQFIMLDSQNSFSWLCQDCVYIFPSLTTKLLWFWRLSAFSNIFFWARTVTRNFDLPKGTASHTRTPRLEFCAKNEQQWFCKDDDQNQPVDVIWLKPWEIRSSYL